MLNSSFEISSLSGYLEQLGKFNDKESHLFRGLDSNSYALCSGIARQKRRKFNFAHQKVNDETNKWSEDNLIDEIKIMEAFESKALPLAPYVPRSKIEWMALAQHYGLPTRLLDWTFNPLVAAYFAVRQMGSTHKDKGRDGSAIWAMPKPPLVSSEDLYNIKGPELFVPPNISPNISAQSSVFTIQRPDGEFPTAGKTFFIALKYEAKIKIELNSIGINGGSLFPDIRGLCEELRWKYKWHKI